MNKGVAGNGGAHDTLTCRLLTELARPPLAILALAAVLGGAPAQAISADTPVIAAGGYHTCVLSSAGAVQCWGENAHGELGNGTTDNSSVPVAVSGLSNGVVAIAAGKSHTCALTSAGAMQCWGDNQFGQLGDGRKDTFSRMPVAVSRLSGRVVAVAAGAYHTCALSSAGAVQCWGENAHGELGNGTTDNSSVPVAVSGLSSGVVAIAAGRSHTCALTAAGAMQCWGDNQFGQLGDGRKDTFSRMPVAVSRLSSGVVVVATGDYHTCARTSGGATQCWGENTYGALGDGTTTNSSAPVAVSGLSAYMRSRDAGATDGAPPLRTFGALPG